MFRVSFKTIGRRVLLVAVPVLVSFGAGSITFASSDWNEAAAIRRAVAKGELVPLPRILTLAKRHVPGEVIKVEIEQEQGILIYEVKMLKGDGHVREVKLNARSGALIAVEDD